MKSFGVGTYAATALVNQDISTTFNVDNCIIIYEADAVYKSWKPERTINAISAFEVGKGYIIVSLEETDVTGKFSDGLPAGTTGFLIANTTGANITFNYVDDSGVVKGTLQTVTDSHGKAIQSLPSGATSIKMTSDITNVDLVQVMYFSPTQVNFGEGPATDIFITDNSVQITDYLDLAASTGGFMYYIFKPHIEPTPPPGYVEISNYSTHEWSINNSDGGATIQTLAAGLGVKIPKADLDEAGVTTGLTFVATDGSSFTSLMQRPNADPYINDSITTNFSISTVQSTHSLFDGDIKVQLLDR